MENQEIETSLINISPQLCETVQNFFKQSQQIQYQIERLGQLCMDLALPKLSPWQSINAKLLKRGLPQLQLTNSLPSYSNLLSLISQLLKSLKTPSSQQTQILKQKLSKAQQKINRLQAKICQQKSKSNQLQSKLTAVQNSNTLISTIKSPTTQKQHLFFRQFMHRDYKPKYLTDTKIMAMIRVLINSKQTTPTKKRKSTTISSLQAGPILDLIYDKLQANSPQQALHIIETLVQAIKQMPTTKQFLQELMIMMNKTELQPQEVLWEIQQLKDTTAQFNSFKNEIIPALGIEDPAQIIQKCKVVGYFRKLFQIENNELEVIEQVFWYVHQVKQFFSQVRQKLKIDESLPTNKLFQIIFKKLIQILKKGRSSVSKKLLLQ